MTAHPILAALGVTVVATVAPLTLNTLDAGAQVGTPTPCTDCADANSGIGAGPGLDFGWECLTGTDGRGLLVATAWVPPRWGGPVTFAFPGLNPDLVTLQPGQTRRLVTEAGNGDDIVVSGRIFGHRVDRQVNQGPFACPCEQGTSTSVPRPTTPPTSPPSSTPPPSVPVTPPGTGTPPPASTVPGTPFELPATGPTGGDLLFVVFTLGAAGLFLGMLARRGIHADAQDINR